MPEPIDEPTSADPADVTGLLAAARRGDPTAFDRLVPAVYTQLRGLARRVLAREGAAATLNATGLVHEAWMRLAEQDSIGAEHRGEFFGAAATAMRRVLVDRARARLSDKRGGGAERVPLDEAEDDAPLDQLVDSFESSSGSLVALDEALAALAQVDERQARLVDLRFFAGLRVDEAASLLGVSRRQAERDWTHARAWLRVRIEEQHG